MKKTIITVACAMFLSTGAIANPGTHQPAPHHNTHIIEHMHRPTHSVHRPNPHHMAPAPRIVQHNHYHNNLGEMMIALAILATAM